MFTWLKGKLGEFHSVLNLPEAACGSPRPSRFPQHNLLLLAPQFPAVVGAHIPASWRACLLQFLALELRDQKNCSCNVEDENRREQGDCGIE
jgi:hypothetical protein